MSDDLLTVREVAQRIEITEKLLRMWILRGKAPRSVKVGSARLFHLEDVRAWEADQTARAAQAES